MLFIFENNLNFLIFINMTTQKVGSSFIRGIFFSQTMGGAKKPTAAKKDKPAKLKESKKGKKDKGEGGPKKSRDHSYGK